MRFVFMERLLFVKRVGCSILFDSIAVWLMVTTVLGCRSALLRLTLSYATRRFASLHTQRMHSPSWFEGNGLPLSLFRYAPDGWGFQEMLVTRIVAISVTH